MSSGPAEPVEHRLRLGVGMGMGMGMGMRMGCVSGMNVRMLLHDDLLRPFTEMPLL